MTVVGATGFEPATPCSQRRHSNQWVALIYIDNNIYIIKLNWLKLFSRCRSLRELYPVIYPADIERNPLPYPHKQGVIPAEITKRIAEGVCRRGSFPAEGQSNTGQPPALGRYSWNENRGQMESVEVAA